MGSIKGNEQRRKQLHYKKQINSAEEGLTNKLPPCTDNSNTPDSDFNNYDINTVTLQNSKSDLSIAIINCQSIIAKKASFHNFVAEHNPDIVAGCESWLTSSIKSAEVFPRNLKIYG